MLAANMCCAIGLGAPTGAAAGPYLFMVLMLFGVGLVAFGVGAFFALYIEAPREDPGPSKR